MHMSTAVIIHMCPRAALLTFLSGSLTASDCFDGRVGTLFRFGILTGHLRYKKKIVQKFTIQLCIINLFNFYTMVKELETVFDKHG